MVRKIYEARNLNNAEINKKIANTIKTKLTKEPKYRADLEAEGFELFNDDGSAYNNWEVRGTNGNTVCISKGYDNKPRIYDGYSPVATKDSIDDFDFYNYLTMNLDNRRDYRVHGGIGKTNGEIYRRKFDGSAVDADYSDKSKTQTYLDLKNDINRLDWDKKYYSDKIKAAKDKLSQLEKDISDYEQSDAKTDLKIAAKLDDIDKLLKDMKVRTDSNESLSKNINEGSYKNEYILIDKDGNEVKFGDEVKDFRGDTDIITDISKIPDGHSTGKVITASGREFYPGVFNLTIVPKNYKSNKPINEDAKSDWDMARPNHSKILTIIDKYELNSKSILDSLLSFLPDPDLKDFAEFMVTEYDINE